MIRTVALATVVALVAADAGATTPSDRFRAALERVAKAEPAGLRVSANGGTASAFRLEERIDYHFESARDGHLLALHVDSHGVASVLVPSFLAPDATIRAGEVLVVEGLKASAPVGHDTVYAVVTERPLDLDAIGLADASACVRTFDEAAALALAERLAEALSSADVGAVAVAESRTRIAGGDEIEYTVAQVVRQLVPTRSVPRPRIDFHKVTFAFDSDVLTEQARTNLDVVGQALRASALGDERFVLGGHTDDVGSPEYNDELSRRRAESAKSYLVETWHVAPERIEIRGYGEARPLVSEETDDARATNRRVELEVVR
jgi:outer membrane protein OmpA-like peptidoglycan-associated protein